MIEKTVMGNQPQLCTSPAETILSSVSRPPTSVPEKPAWPDQAGRSQQTHEKTSLRHGQAHVPSKFSDNSKDGYGRITIHDVMIRGNQLIGK